MGCTPLKKSHQPVVICGGGIIGCATAYYLAKKGVKSIILEASGIATGSSGKAGGFLARDWLEGSPAHELSMKSFEMHMELAKEFTDCDYRRLDTLAVTARYGRKRKSLGLCPLWLSQNIQQVSTLGAKNNTAQVHPFKLTQTFLKKAQDMVGVEVRECEVIGFLIDSHHDITGVKISDGAKEDFVEASDVVMALGPWSCLEALRDLGIAQVKCHKAASIVIGNVQTTPHALFMSYTPKQRKDHSEEEEVASVMHYEWYPRPDNTLFICGEDTEVKLPAYTTGVKPGRAAIKHLTSVLNAICPAFSKNVIKEQACYLPITEDGMPLIGKVPSVNGLYIGTGHSVWGILCAPCTGEALAQLICYGHCDLLDLKNFDPCRDMQAEDMTDSEPEQPEEDPDQDEQDSEYM